MSFIENFSFRILWVGAITLILLIMGVLFFSLKNKAENKLALAQSAMIAASLKQELVIMKLKKDTLTPAGQESYEMGLLAEFKGDREFARQKYESTQEVYREAIHYFGKAFDRPNDSTFVASRELLKNHVTSGNTGIVEEAWWLDENEIKLKAKKIYDDAIARARSALVVEQSSKRREKVIDITVAKNIDTRLESKLERAQDEEQPTEIQQQEQVESTPDPALIEQTSDSGNSLTYEMIEQKIESLIQRYEESLNNKDLQGIKILFKGHFTKGDEKTWKEFFEQVKKLRVTVLKEKLEIKRNTANVVLSVFIEYLGHDGPQPMRRGFVESWILEVQNGELIFSSRKTTV